MLSNNYRSKKALEDVAALVCAIGVDEENPALPRADGRFRLIYKSQTKPDIWSRLISGDIAHMCMFEEDKFPSFAELCKYLDVDTATDDYFSDDHNLFEWPVDKWAKRIGMISLPNAPRIVAIISVYYWNNGTPKAYYDEMQSPVCTPLHK